jgi:ubiquinone/menaquinone biosynthesis C-methylase UbiE
VAAAATFLQHAFALNPDDGKRRMSLYGKWIVPRLIDCAMRQARLVPYRERAISAARSRVLEIGVGSGLNLAHYGAQVEQVVGIDPSSELLAGARSRARAARPAIMLVRASAERLPFRNASYDAIVMTWTLCSIPDPRAALAEMRRVLHPHGRLLFVEHGLAPEPSVRRWQNWLTPAWRRIGGGCHLNRKMDALMTEAGFRIRAMHAGYMAGPKPMTYMYEGEADSPASR